MSFGIKDFKIYLSYNVNYRDIWFCDLSVIMVIEVFFIDREVLRFF